MACCGTGEYYCTYCREYWEAEISNSDNTSDLCHCGRAIIPRRIHAYEHRTYGYFTCEYCNNDWESAYAYYNWEQGCQICYDDRYNNYVYPYKTTRLLCPVCQNEACQCYCSVFVTASYNCIKCQNEFAGVTPLYFQGRINLDRLRQRILNGYEPICHRYCRYCRYLIIPDFVDLEKVYDDGMDRHIKT